MATNVIEASHYQDTRNALIAENLVAHMYVGLDSVPTSEIAHDDGTPRFAFMQAANAEYSRRGGSVTTHLGAVTEVLLTYRKSDEASGRTFPTAR